jgi:hypothetical protein
MKNQRQTIRKIVGFLNDPDADGGGFWLPNIQRPFVWDEEQVCKLYDSIMREYPISTLLVWSTTNRIRCRKFIDNWKSSLKLTHFNQPENDLKKCLVLDGQQRLQSLFIGLCGSYEGRELHFEILSGELAAPEDIKFKFKFLDTKTAAFPWVLFKQLIFTTKKKRELMDELKAKASTPLNDKQVNKLEDHLDLIDRTFKMDEAVTYQVLDSIDNPALYSEDDVVEVFIRANDGGTKLGKSDLLFSLLSANWEVADEKMEALLESLNRHGFAFDRDFVLKTFLVLLGKRARYEVRKFREAGVRDSIEAKWDEVTKAIKDVLDFVRGKTFIQCDKALPSYLVLIPLIHVRFQFPDEWDKAKDVDKYLLRCLLTAAFSGQPDNLLDALHKCFSESGMFSAEDAFEEIRKQNRSLELTEDRFWELGYGSDAVHLLFNLWYRDFNYTPAYDNNLPQVDHIFPQSQLRKVKEVNPTTGRRDLVKYKAPERNQLANCMLLSREENGAGGKGDTLPDEWFKGKSKEYLDMHLIPDDPNLWQLDRFEDFIEARKKLIRKKFKDLMV